MGAFEIFEPRSEAEMERVWRFNHRIFAEELGQHARHEDGLLVDKFHHKNIYRAARPAGSGELVGLICAHFEAPYSVEEKIGRPVAPPADGGKLGEIRLYAVAPEHRKGMVSALVGVALLLELDKRGVSEVVISGISLQKPTYEKLGFAVFADPAPGGRALFYPMRAKLAEVLARLRLEVAKCEKSLN
jgi:hypothetical protein